MNTVFRDAAQSPDVGLTPFTVEAHSTEIDHGVSTRDHFLRQESWGIIQPGKDEQRDKLPEEDRRELFISIFTTYGFSTGELQTGLLIHADRVLWNNRRWRVVACKEWVPFDFFLAYAVLEPEAEKADGT